MARANSRRLRSNKDNLDAGVFAKCIISVWSKMSAHWLIAALSEMFWPKQAATRTFSNTEILSKGCGI